MPLSFALVCDLLEQSHQLCISRKSNANAVASWFARNRDRVDAHDTNLAALLSTLLPEKRTDRVYCIQAQRLEKIIGRALMLGSSRIAELTRYKQPGLNIDLADCVERLLSTTPNPMYDEKDQVSVEEVDNVLHDVARRVIWSSPAIRTSQASLIHCNQGNLENIYRRLGSKEAKWFTRLILKDYQPLTFDPYLIYRLCDPILPLVLKIQDDFTAAITAVQNAKSELLPNAARRRSRNLLHLIDPVLGVKVGRQQWLKARSIKHCLDMGHGRMSVEEKIDGEYCQIHIDLSKGDRCLQIFSKSGKDSTEDRQNLQSVILESLRIGKSDARVSRGCILEGELVVYDDLEHRILPFHKIRKHVSRRGRYLNTEQDSIPHPHEHLMIIYYDILFLDGVSFINVRRSERYKALIRLIDCRKGHAELVKRQIIDFNHPFGASSLRKAFAQVITSRKEGLVLKPDDPYFDFSSQRRQYSGSCIKMKKEYIGTFGDVGDFAVVGARYDPAKARNYRIPNLKWTHFYVGCLENREEVKQWKAKPKFTVVNVVELNETMLTELVGYGNPMEVPVSENTALVLKLTPGVQQGTPLSVVFTNPLVFDLRCFSFDEVGNTGFWSLRFPVVTKIHFDRNYTDTVSFSDLQNLAEEATTAPTLEDSQENLEWIAKLEGADPRGIAVDATSQQTMTTMSTPSPRRSTQSTWEPWSSTSPVTARVMAAPISPLQRIGAARGHEMHKMPVSLITPAISSPAAPLPANIFAVVSKLSPSQIASSPQKRQRVQMMTVAKQSIGKPSLQTRKPLKDINGNSQATSTPPSPPQDLENRIIEVIDLTSPGGPCVTVELTRVTSPQSATARSPAESTSTITANDDNDTSEIQVLLETPRCQLAGENCGLATSTILISQTTPIASTEAEDYFDLHGLWSRVTELEEWLQKDHELATNSADWKPNAHLILFVDSIHDQGHTKTLLSHVERARSLLPEDRRNWITVYDWQMLKYLSIMEDESITSKSYDGWHDPWRRWYCGII